MPTLELEEVTELEDLFLDDLVCGVPREANHQDCLIKAAYRVSCCREEGFWCEIQYDNYLRILATPKAKCLLCHRPVVDRWKIIKI